MLANVEMRSRAHDNLPPTELVHERPMLTAPTIDPPVADAGGDDESAHHPTPTEIALVAYHLYAARGCQDGADVEDWLTAEDMLRRQSRLGG